MRPTLKAGAVQVAGVQDVDEAELLLDCGVEYLGFPLRLDFHTQDCSEDEAAHIVAAVGSRAECVLITYETNPAELAKLARSLGVSWVQLHAPMSTQAVGALRESAPELSLLKSLVVRPGAARLAQEELDRHVAGVDAFLTDTFDPMSGASGATGLPHDWAVSRALVRRSTLPVVLAGGLTPGNVASAIEQVRPVAVDVHTGVEGPSGRKDESRVRRFVGEARRAFGVC
jgi:phosphoribosylanthranilate isomerase